MWNHNESLCTVAVRLECAHDKVMGRKGAERSIDPINVHKRFR